MVVDRVAGTFSTQVVGQLREEDRDDRDQALVAALAVGDEHPPFTRVHIPSPQAQHLATAQAAAQQQPDHRPVTVRP